MSAAVLPLPGWLNRLLVVDQERGEVQDRMVHELPELLREGDLLVVNDAATLPASLSASAQGQMLEVRLAGPVEEGWAVLFGPGSWRVDTDLRLAPPRFEAGDHLVVAGVGTRVLEVSELSPRLVRLELDPARVWKHGRPVQYSYMKRPLHIAEVQTPYAGRPWAVEMPSAGRPLTHSLRADLDDAGIQVVSLTHAAGLSATGDAALDALLPLPERYEIPSATWQAVLEAERVVAVGTSVVRALESGARGPLAGTTSLRLGPGSDLQVVDALLSGMHEPGESHFQLMAAFMDLGLLRQATRHAVQQGYRNHEFGDSTLVI